MAKDKVVPVVIKLLTEADNSLDAAVAAASAKIKTLQGDVGSSLSSTITQVAEKTAAQVSRAIRPETIQIFSERALQQTQSAINSLAYESSALNDQLKKIEAQNSLAFNAGLIDRNNSAVKDLSKSAAELESQQKKIATQLLDQAEKAEKLKNIPAADFVNAKAQYQSAQILTKQLQDEAELIRKSYQSAFEEVNKQIRASASAQEKIDRDKSKVQKEVKERIESPGAAISTRAAELRQVRLQLEITESINRAESRRLDVQKRQLELQEKISNAKKSEDKNSLSARFIDLNAIDQRAVESRARANSALIAAELAAQNQIAAIKQGKTTEEVGRLRVIAEQSRFNAQSLTRDAKKIETEYSNAFKKLSSDANKAGKEIEESIKGSVSGKGSNALNFLAPLTNQFSGVIDSFLGSLGAKLGGFRTAVGAQIGLSIGRGISDGINRSGEEIAKDRNSLVKFFESLDAPAKQVIANVGTGIVVASAAASAAMLGLVGVTVQVAGRFEALEAQLVTAFKDPILAANRFREAVELASKTPFNVEQVVQASVSLSVRGEKSLAVLKDVTELAAAQGRDLNETAIAVGHATEGSVRGYEALRNSFGVTTSRLKEFGAVVDNQNRILVHNEYQINRNREALLNLIRTDFGGGVERLSKTLVGLQSNLKDEIEKVSASFGNIFLPSMKAAVKAATDFLQLVNSLPQEFKYMIAGTVATTAAIATMVAGFGAATLSVNVLTSATAGLLAIPAVEGLTGISSALKLIQAGAGGASSALLTIGSIAPFIAVLVAGTIALQTGISSYEESARKAGEETLEFSKRMADARRVSLELNNEIQKTFQLPPQFKLDLNDSAKAMEQLIALIRGKGTLGITADLSNAGVKNEELNKELEQKTNKIKQIKKESEELRGVYEKLKEAIKGGDAAFTREEVDLTYGQNKVVQVKLTLDSLINNANTASRIISQFPSLEGQLDLDKAQQGLKGIENQLGASDKALNQFTQRTQYIRTMTHELGLVDSALGAVQKSITRTQGFTQFAVASKDVSVLNRALQDEQSLYQALREQLKALTQDHKVSSESVAKFAAQNTDSAKALAQAYFKTRENIIQLNSALLKNKAEDTKTELDAIETIGAYRVATRQRSEREEKLSDLRSQKALIDGSFSAYNTLYKEFKDIQEQIKTTEDHEERDRLFATSKFIEDKLKLYASAAKDEIKVIKEISAEEQAIRANTVAHTKDAVTDLINSIKQQASGEKPILSKSFFVDGKEIKSLNTLKNNLSESGTEALSAHEKIKIFQSGLSKLNDIASRSDIKALRKESIEADKTFREAGRSLEEGLVKARLEIPIENFRNIRNQINDTINKSESLRGKLENIRVAEASVSLSRNRGLITTKDAEKELVDLGKQRHDIQGQITRAYEEQLVELSKLRDKELDNELKILELKKNTPNADRNSIDSEIANRKRQQIQSEIQTLAQEREKELEAAKKSGKDRELILEKYRLKESSFIKQAYLEYAKAEEDKFKAVEERLKKEQAEVDKYKEKRIGGKNSPLISLEELGFQSTLPGFGSDLYADKTKPFDNKIPFNFGGDITSRGGNELLTYEQFKAQYEAKNRIKVDSKASQLPSPTSDINPVNQTSVTNYVYINGSTTNDKDIINKASSLVNDSLKKKSSLNQTFSGPTSGGLSTPDNYGTPGHGPAPAGVPGY